MNRKTLIGFALILLGLGLFFYSKVVVEEKILNIFLHDPNQLLVDVPLQMLLKREQFLQTFTEILSYVSGATGVSVLLAGVFLNG